MVGQLNLHSVLFVEKENKMTTFERSCWRVALKLLIQIALLTMQIGKRNNVIYDMSDEIREARTVIKEL